MKDWERFWSVDVFVVLVTRHNGLYIHGGHDNSKNKKSRLILDSLINIDEHRND